LTGSIDVRSGLTIIVDGVPIRAVPGDTLSACLIRAGILATRTARNGSARAFYCGMGVCHECSITVDGVAGVRACVTPASEGVTVVTTRT